MGEILLVLMLVAVFLLGMQSYEDATKEVEESLLYGESPCDCCSLVEECTEAFLCGL